jgi:hypothetical protein
MSGGDFTRFRTHLAHDQCPIRACINPGLLPNVFVTSLLHCIAELDEFLVQEDEAPLAGS